LKEVVVAMSGGVDSSVTLLRLKELGYAPVGLTLTMWDKYHSEQYKDAVRRARRVCDKIGIRHVSLDVRAAFEAIIVDHFVDEYLKGVTPNPCVECNPKVKWKSIIDFADQNGIGQVATGHYARVEVNSDSRRFEILKGLDPRKNQSYVLWQLSQEYLARTILPLGMLHKTEVYQIAEKYSFRDENQSESQDVCFIPHNSYRDFLEKHVPERLKAIPKGELVDEAGKVLGQHNGFYNFTIGQRKGFRMGFGERRYVKQIDAGQNRVVIGDNPALFRSEMIIQRVNWVSQTPQDELEGSMQIRYNHPGVECRVTRISAEKYRVTFAEPQRAVTPGQSAVLYRGDKLLLGGIIYQ